MINWYNIIYTVISKNKLFMGFQRMSSFDMGIISKSTTCTPSETYLLEFRRQHPCRWIVFSKWCHAPYGCPPCWMCSEGWMLHHQSCPRWPPAGETAERRRDGGHGLKFDLTQGLQRREGLIRPHQRRRNHVLLPKFIWMT